MSMLNAGTPYRREDRHSVRVPVVMPLVEVAVDGGGHLAVLLDHEPYSAEGVLRRDDLKRVLDGIACDLGTPVRVEVHEADGSTFADIITPAEPAKPKLRVVPTAGQLSGPIGEVSGTGFLANEEVAVAVVVARQIAGTDGTARLHLPPALLEAHPGMVVLMGQQSGTVMVSGAVAAGAAGAAGGVA